MAVKLVTDSTSYIDPATREQLDIRLVPLSVHFAGQVFLETETDWAVFFERIAGEDTIPTSSQPAPGQMYQVFEELVRKGDEVVGIFISARMSGTYESAVQAKDMVLQEYPQAKITILDSATNCMALGLVVLHAARAAARGVAYDEVVKLAQETIDRVHFYFVPATLEYLKKGGRIGGAAALLGTMLNIKPVLFVHVGTTQVYKKARGFRNALDILLQVLQKEDEQHQLGEIIVHHIHCYEKASGIAEAVKEKVGLETKVMPIGPVIGLHVGPGAIGIAFRTIR